METRNDKEGKVNNLSVGDAQSLEYLADKLLRLKKKGVVTEESVKELESSLVELMGMVHRHQDYLRRWLKQEYILD